MRFAAAADDVFGDLVHELDIALHARANDGVDRVEVRPDEILDG